MEAKHSSYTDGSAEVPPTEVVPKAKWCRFGASYKLCILDEPDACCIPGEVGSLLRWEGIYSSQLVQWRKQRERGWLAMRPVALPLAATHSVSIT